MTWNLLLIDKWTNIQSVVTICIIRERASILPWMTWMVAIRKANNGEYVILTYLTSKGLEYMLHNYTWRDETWCHLQSVSLNWTSTTCIHSSSNWKRTTNFAVKLLPSSIFQSLKPHLFIWFCPLQLKQWAKNRPMPKTTPGYLNKNTEKSPEICPFFRCQIGFVDLVVETESQMASNHLIVDRKTAEVFVWSKLCGHVPSFDIWSQVGRTNCWFNKILHFQSNID